MQISVEIADDLMREVLEVTGLTTEREAIEEGLRMLLKLRRQAGLHDLRGIGWGGDLDDMRCDKDRPKAREIDISGIRELRGTVERSTD